MQLLCLFSQTIFALLQKVSSSVEKREIYSHLKYFVKIAFTISRIFFCLQKSALMGVNSCNFHTVSPKSFLTPKIKHCTKLSLQNFYHNDSSLCNSKSCLANNFFMGKNIIKLVITNNIFVDRYPFIHTTWPLMGLILV